MQSMGEIELLRKNHHSADRPTLYMHLRSRGEHRLGVQISQLVKLVNPAMLCSSVAKDTGSLEPAPRDFSGCCSVASNVCPADTY